MKLEEAAAILGVHPDTPIETLKQTYRRLALAWHPEKCTSPNAKEKFQQISIAYTKIISAQSVGGKRLDDGDSDDDNGSKRGDESHEMAAFMRMFMDLVGIFNEDQSLCEDGKIPAAGVSFGMMFGSRTGTAEDWSTEDEADIEECDEESVEFEELYDSETEEGLNSEGNAWEPPAKQYSQMDLKEEVHKERQLKLSEITEQDIEVTEEIRRLKNAKRRAEKRRKQKDKKVQEAVAKAEEEEELQHLEECKRREEEEAAQKLEDDIRMVEQAKIKFSLDLFKILRSDDCIKAKDIIGEALKPVKSSKSKPVVTELTHRLGFIRELLLNQPLLHCCVNDPSSRTDSDATDSPADGKIITAQYLLELRSDLIDLGIRDEDGRTALHLAAKKEDNAFLKLLLSAREDTIERRAQLDINARCGKSGWTVLHYAAGQGDITAVRLLMKAGATLTVQATVGKAATPLDLVKTRLQNAGHFSASHIANLQLVSTEISEAIQNQDRIRQQKEAEMLLKEEKLEMARKITAEREEKERELLLRKQKQLKDKQEKDRSRDSIGIEEGKKSLKSSSGASSTAVGTSSVTKLSSKESLGSLTVQSSATAATSQSPTLTPSVTPSPSIDLTDSFENSKSAKKKKKKDKKLEQELELEVSDTANASSRVTVVDVASRDELVDHLLAMGFDESDCFSAVSLFGRDLDRSLSWLCDRPAVKSDIDDQVGSATATARGHGTSSSAGAGAGTGDSSDGATALTEGSLTQRDNDLPSQLRSVNRAWNLKAEDEKKRTEAEKRQKEDVRQNDLQQLLHRQQQQQQQLQLPLRPSTVTPFSHGVASSSNSGVTDLKSIGYNRKASPFPSSNSAGGPTILSNTHTGLPDTHNDPRRRDITYPPSLPSSDHALYASQLQALQSQGHPTSKPDGRTQRSYAYQQQLQQAPPNGTPLLPPGPSALYGLKQGVIRNVPGEGSSRIPFNGASDVMDPGTFSRGFGLRGTHSSSVSEENFNGYFGGSNHREQSGPPANQPYDGNAFSDLRGQGLMNRAPHSAVQGNDSNSSAKLNYAPPGFLFNRKNDSQVLSQGPHGTMGGPGVNRQVGPGGFNTPPGMSQQRSAHQASQLQTSSQLNYLNQSLNQNQSLLSEVPMRSQNSVFSSAGFDNPSLGRNTHMQPAGQSQQVFHSQQQLQEQESSRLHHQSQQYLFQEYGNDEGVKAKSFNTQYAASKGSNFFGAPPAHTQHSQYSNKIQGYSSGSVKNMNMAVSKGPQPQGPSPQPWEQSSPFRGQGGDGRGQSMLNGSLSGTGVGLDPQLGQHFQDSRAQGPGQGQGHSGGQGRAGFPFDSHQSNGTGNGFDASLLSSLMSNSPSSLSGSRTPQRLSSQPSDAGGSHHHSNSYSHSHSLGSNSSYPSSSIGRSLSGTMASINLTDLDDSADRRNFHLDNISLNKSLVGLGRDSRDDGNYFSSERFTQSADSDDRVHSFFNHRDHPRVPGNEINARLRQGQELDPFQARSLLPTQGVRSLSGPISNPGSIQDSFRSSDLSRF